jgi:hypothetical protein
MHFNFFLSVGYTHTSTHTLRYLWQRFVEHTHIHVTNFHTDYVGICLIGCMYYVCCVFRSPSLSIWQSWTTLL